MINSLQNLFQYTSVFSYSILAIATVVALGFLIKFFIQLNLLFKEFTVNSEVANQILKNEATLTNKVAGLIIAHKNRAIFLKSMTSGLFLFTLIQDILKDEETK